MCNNGLVAGKGELTMILQEYEGYKFPETSLIKNKSSYNHNYYKGLNGEEIYAVSDDDNYTEYFIAGIPFAESFISEGDILHVYDDFKFEKVALTEGCLQNWYIDAVFDTDPVWTDKHISELFEDFYCIFRKVD